MWKALDWFHLAQERSNGGFRENDDKTSGYINVIELTDKPSDC
jgi:hypothetical protein